MRARRSGKLESERPSRTHLAALLLDVLLLVVDAGLLVLLVLGDEVLHVAASARERAGEGEKGQPVESGRGPT